MKNVPDDMLRIARGRSNELPPPGSARWGKVARLATGTNVVAGKPQSTLDFVHTGIIADQPTPIAIKMRFSLDGTTYTPEVPASLGGVVHVKLIETIDMKSGAFLETFDLNAGDTQPLCTIMAMALDLSVTLDGEDVHLFVEVVAAPTTMIDCGDIVPPPPTTPASYSNTTIARYPAATASTYNIAANSKRATVVVVNQSAANLFVSMHAGVTITPGSEFASVVLPGGSFAGTGWDNYTGQIYFKFDADDADGYALVTEGLYP